MNGLTWLNDLMTWLARWIPRLTLIPATNTGVLFGPRGAVRACPPGLIVYWPITHQLKIVSTLWRTIEISGQLNQREILSLVIIWRIADALAAILRFNDATAFLDDRAQAALAVAYDPHHSNDQIEAIAHARLCADFGDHGVIIERVSVSQRGQVRAIKLVNDWATHEARGV